MHLLRLILLLFTALAQSWPAQALVRDADAHPACAMGCCAAFAETGSSTCACLDEPSSPPFNPASSTPAGSREALSQVVWVTHEVQMLPRPAQNLVRKQACPAERGTGWLPHVRRPVLFCSLLN